MSALPPTSLAPAWETELEPVPPGTVSREAHLMGGLVTVLVEPRAVGASASPEGATRAAEAAVGRTLRRLRTWADRLTRFDPASELSRLNADPSATVPVGPTLAAVLDWGRAAEARTDGIVDIALLDARLAAEHGTTVPQPDLSYGGRTSSPASLVSPASRAWSMERHARGAVIRRPPGVRFDLDGIGKGWLADRALDGLRDFPAAVVDADGDVAIRLDPDVTWWFGVADPRRPDHDLGVLRLDGRTRRGGLSLVGGRSAGPGRFGLATSGTSVHRWARDGRVAHHLIDPRTGYPAATDIVQATVLARSARLAEALAKAAVILGRDAGLRLLDHVGVDGALLITVDGDLVLHRTTGRWLT